MYNSYYEKILTTGEVKCIDDEIPFEIPESWEWCRVRDISQSYIGLTYSPLDVCEDGDNKGTIVLRSSNIKNGSLNLNDIVRVKIPISEKLQVNINDIIICARNGSKKLVGKSALIEEISEPMTFGAFMAICKTSLYGYIYLFLQSELFFSQLRKVSDTTTINQLTQNNFNNFLVPIPPYCEQRKIIKKFQELSPVIDRYNSVYERAYKIESTLFDILKKSILQYAIQGKLVPQIDTEEPATILLEQIRAEKLRLLKEGKLKKKDIQESVIFKDDDNRYYEKVGKVITDITEDLPYEIPESWQWVSLDMITYLVGTKHNQIQTKDILKTGDYPVVSQGQNLIEGFCDDATKVISNIPLIMFGDHTRNVKYVDFPFVIGADGTKFHKCILVNEKYVYYWMIVGAEQLNDRGYARHYSLLKKKFIPLPPLAEQTRIVNALNSVLKSIEGV